MQQPIVAVTGQQSGVLDIPQGLLEVAVHPHLLWQVVTGEAANRRLGCASTKTRSEMRGGGAKPWRQKGTGRARQGSNRAPQWTGGAVSHGPKPRTYRKETPRKQRRIAFFGLLAERLRRGDVVVVDSLPLSEGKTQEILRLVKTITGAMEGAEVDLGKSKLLILLNRPEEKLVRAAGNLSNLRVRLLQGVLLADLLWADRLILTAPVAQDVFKEAEKWLVKPSKS